MLEVVGHDKLGEEPPAQAVATLAAILARSCRKVVEILMRQVYLKAGSPTSLKLDERLGESLV